MDLKITTYQTLRYLVGIDKNDHKIKDIARLFLEATNDWPSKNSRDIYKTIHEFKALFGDRRTADLHRQKICFTGRYPGCKS